MITELMTNAEFLRDLVTKNPKHFNKLTLSHMLNIAKAMDSVANSVQLASLLFDGKITEKEFNEKR